MPVNFTGSYTQNFNTLANTGTSSTLPTDWVILESSSNANTTYTANDGSSGTGDTYSYGTTTDRALGGLQSGSLIPSFGASFTNTTGSPITSLQVSYTGEQWRLGATGRTDRLDFQYSLDASSLSTGTWTDVNTLDFTAPVTTGTVGALNGNVSPNRTAITTTLTGLNIPNGATFWFRWQDLNATGADDGLAIDDFSLSVPTPQIFTVTNTNDSGAGSLRQAIQDANADPTTADTITFAGVFADATPDIITLTSGQLSITGNLTIAGTGTNLLTISGNNTSRIFNHSSGSATITGLSLINGFASGTNAGGAILQASGTSLNLNQVSIRNNRANWGGGINSDGTLVVDNSTISGNIAALNAGGISSFNAPFTLRNSTVSGNSSLNFDGDGVVTGGANATILNTTIANHAQRGISNSGTLTTIANTLIVGNGDNSINGTVTSQANSLAGTFAALGVDATLANNGGSTQSHALLTGSSAINAGSNAALPADTLDRDGDSNTTEPIPFDQRGTGYDRLRGSTVDVGAFEVQTITPSVNLSVSSTAGTEAGTTVITVTATADSAVSGNQTVTLGVSGIGITAGDYSLSNTTLTIPNGATTGSVTFTVVDDAIFEGSETATLTISNPSSGIVLGSTTTQDITITDNDFPVVTLAAGTNPIEGGTQGTYTLTLDTPAPVGGLTVNYNLIGSTATNPADYTLSAGTNITAVTGTSFTIAAGQTSATLLVNAVNDGTADPNETIQLNLTAGSGYTTGYNTTTPFTAASPVPVGASPYSVVIGDFNGDGRADFAAANYSSNTVSIRLGDGLGGFTGNTDVAVGSNPFSVAIGDFNGDGKADIATANINSSSVSIRLGNGLGGFSGNTDVGVGPVPQSVAIGDFNGDGKADIATANVASNTVSIRLGNGLGGFSGGTNVIVRSAPFGSGPFAVAIGDFNGDGKADFATNGASNTLSIWLGDGLGGFSGSTNVAVGSSPNSVVIGDFNGDGKTDLATANSGSNSVSIRLGDGLGGFSGNTNLAVGVNPQSVVIGDFNGDGKADLATANSGSNSVSIRLGDGLGGFSGSTDVAAGGGTYSVAISDFNGDGKADIATANSGSGNVSVLLNNDPSATLTIAEPPTVNLSVSTAAGTEAGTTVITVTATASAAVTGNQTVSLGVSGTGITAGDYSLSNTTITIPDGQTTGSVTFTVVDDAIFEGTETATLIISNPSSGITLGSTTSQAITITDNDTAGVMITQSDGNTAVTEGGATDTYTVVLNSQPTSDVTIALNSGTQATTNPTTLTFTAANWNVAQTVTVTAVNDSIAEGTHSGTIMHSATSADTNYNAITIGSVSTAITDNDSAGVTIVQSGGNTTLTEGGATDTYTVVLNSQPTADVTISLNTGAQTSTSPTSLTFTAANWNVAQTITVTAVNDAIAEDSHTGTITHTASSSDSNYNGITISSVTATITDNDTAGVIINQSGGNTAVTEGGATDTYTVVLNSQPTNDVTITVSNGSQTNTSPTTLTFTTANWNVAQTVTVTAVDDLLNESTHSGTISHSASSSDSNYNGIAIAPVNVTITDNDNPPTDITLSTTSIDENLPANSFVGTFTTTDPDGGSFTYALVSGAGDIHNAAFTLTNSNELRLTPSADYETLSSYTIRIRTTDFSGLTYEKPFTITVNDRNDAPILNDTAVSLATIRTNAGDPVGSVGTLISQIADLTGGSGQNNILDPDAGALPGIAITAANTSNGSWFYSTNNGSTWNDLGTVSDANARLLVADANTRLYFRPNANYFGTIANAITFRAWDQTSGTNGNTANTIPNGNPTAFSTATDTAALEVENIQIDFNTDGNTDILWHNRFSGEIGYWQLDGHTFVQAQAIGSESVDSGWLPIGAGDFTNDGKTDLFWRNRVTGENLVWVMDGAAKVGSVSIETIGVDSGWDVVGVGDFTSDGNADLLWRNRITGENGYWEIVGGALIDTYLIESVAPDSSWNIVGVGDFSGNGNTDILWRNQASGENLYWEMVGSTLLNRHFVESVAVESGWYVAGVGDFNKDSQTDIIWRNQYDGQAGMWIMDGAVRTSVLGLSPTVEPSSGWDIV